nr:MAG TPA: transposase [Caudoviricetes sp.]
MCPCKDCKDRRFVLLDGKRVTCHCICQKYDAWKKQLAKMNAEKRKREWLERL